MKIMYISRRFSENICATIHYKAIKEIFGEQNVYTVDLQRSESYEGEYYIAYGRCNNIKKIVRLLQLNDLLLSNEIINDICMRIQKFQIKKVFIDESGFGKLTKGIKRKFPNIRIVSFFHDIDRMTYKERLRINGITFLPTYITTCHGEKLTQKYSDCNAVLNNRDAKVFEEYYGKPPEVYLPMAVEVPKLDEFRTDEFYFDRSDKKVRYLLFVGAYYYPNLNGLKWFVNQVFSRMSDNYRLVVIGRGMDKIQNDYKRDSRIHIIGGVESLASYYNNADIVIAPIFEGGGMKQKTAEAFAYGRCFVGTTESLLGYEDSLVICENQKKLVYCSNTVEGQLAAFDEIEKNGTFGYYSKLNDLYKKQYSLEAVKAILINILID